MVRKRRSYKGTLKDLIDACLLDVGEELTCELKQKGKIHTATLTADGLIEYKGSYFSPSKWAGYLYGSSQNGWITITARGKTLDYFRKQLNSATESQPSTDFGNTVFEGDAVSELVLQAEPPEILSPGAIEPRDAYTEVNSLQVELESLKSQLSNQQSEIETLNAKIDNLELASPESETENDIVRNLHERVLRLAPYEFEWLVREYLKAKGFSGVEVTGKSHDGGIDGHCEIPFINVRVAFQAKRYMAGNNVGSPPVQQLQGSMRGHFDRGLFITTSDFTMPARGWVDEAKAQITLINGDELTKEMIDLGLGVKAVTVVKHEVDEDFFADLENTR